MKHLAWDEGVAGSDPPTPTITSPRDIGASKKSGPKCGALTASDTSPETSVDPPPENQTTAPVTSRSGGATGKNLRNDTEGYDRLAALDKGDIRPWISIGEAADRVLSAILKNMGKSDAA